MKRLIETDGLNDYQLFEAMMDDLYKTTLSGDDELDSGNPVLHIDENYTTGKAFCKMEQFVECVEKRKHIDVEYFGSLLKFSGDGIVFDRKTKECRTTDGAVCLSEYICLFVESLIELKGETEVTEPFHFALMSKLNGVPTLEEECIEKLKQKVISRLEDPAIKRKRQLRTYNSERNMKSVKNYIDSLFDHYATLMVMRIDFAIKEEYLEKVSLEKMQEYLFRLLNNKRSNNIFNHQVGYIWKFEYGVKKGHHYHVMFFFDGSKVRQDVVYAKIIGEYWENDITGGMGSYYNCNYKKAKYLYLGIGQIKHNDNWIRKNLLMAANYLCKKEQYLFLKLNKKMRTLGKGQILPPKESKVGRPRKLELVNTILNP